VAATLALSFARIEHDNTIAMELLRLCAFLHADAIPEEIFTEGVPVLGAVLEPVAANLIKLDFAIGDLRRFSLIDRNASTNTLTLHRLVQTMLKHQMDQDTQRLWAERMMLAVNSVFPHPEHSTWTQCEHLLPHALLATQYIEKNHIISEEAGHLLHETASYLQDHARYTEAEPLYQRALAIREQQLGPEHPDVAQTLSNLANLYNRQGQYTKAEPLYQRALAIREQQLGPEHPDVALTLNGLATLYNWQGQHARAEPLHQRALHIWEQQLGPEHLRVAYALSNLAALYHEQGQYTKAEPLLWRALQICERRLGPEQHGVAYPLSNLAALYREQGRYAEAEQLFLRALHICKQQVGPEHLDVAELLCEIAELHRRQGKYEQAEPLFVRALGIYEQQLGVEHATTQIVRENYITLLSKMEHEKEEGKTEDE
jgi:tetratricopeptide (TPR) repeat protein